MRTIHFRTPLIAALSVACSFYLFAEKNPYPNLTESEWKTSQYSKTKGVATQEPEVPAGVNGKALKVTATYAGDGKFLNLLMAPGTTLNLPGKIKRISAQIKFSDPRFYWDIRFLDAKGQAKVGDKYFTWVLPLSEGGWSKVTFDIPAKWEQPLTISEIVSHNWGQLKESASVELWICDVQIESDASLPK
jgi:hypothetical protein